MIHENFSNNSGDTSVTFSSQDTDFHQIRQKNTLHRTLREEEVSREDLKEVKYLADYNSFRKILLCS